MLKRDQSVLFLASTLDACAFWRLFMPHLNLPGSHFAAFAGHPDLATVARHDTVVVQRMCTEGQFEFLRAAVAMGMKIVYDLDDDVFDVPEYNPARIPLTMMREGFKACIRMVDVVSVSTRTLAKTVKHHVRVMVNANTGREIPIVVAENRMDERLFAKPAKPDERLTVGWAGSSSHLGDLVLVEDALTELAREKQDIRIQFRGCEIPPEAAFGHLPQFEYKPWSSITEFGARMPQWGWAIALAPVTDHEFNNSKSSIKAVEAAYCGIPCLCSWMRPYEEFCFRDPELKWLLCQTAQQWKSKLRELVYNVARREELGRRAHAVAMEHYSFRRPHEGWRKVLEAARG